VALSEALSDVDDGEHTVTVSATDMLGVSSEAEVTFTVVAAGDGEDDGGADMLAWGLAAIGWIVAVVLLVLMFMRTRKPKAESPMVSDEVEDALSEEPMPPES
jgi:hypothetical protein